MHDVSHDHCWSAGDLGKPIPDSAHAVSVCLPKWEHNVGYEEGRAEVIDRMQTGYPRFFLHPMVRRLFAACTRKFANTGETCFAFPTECSALRCSAFLARHCGIESRVEPYESSEVFAVCFSEAATDTANAYWQHSGEIVSSRWAEAALSRNTEKEPVTDAKRKLRERIARLAGSRIDDVFLFPSGMAAIFCAFRAIQKLRPDSKSIQFGFPYVDTLKILERFGAGVHFFPFGNTQDMNAVRERIQSETIAGLFCEIPSNPLLTTPDLVRLSELSEEHRFPMIVDDTLGALINIDALPAADLLATSLTKFFSGAGDVMAGSLVLNSSRPLYEELREAVLEEYEDMLFEADAVVLERNSRDVEPRVQQINRTAEQLCDSLREHAAIERVDYPKYCTPENYRAFQKPGGGYGGLFSVQLKNAAKTAPAFFDALKISKGPNLGTNFSLCCPYTILAHHDELDFVEHCGISRYLVRVSVGLEDPHWLIARFHEALDGLKMPTAP